MEPAMPPIPTLAATLLLGAGAAAAGPAIETATPDALAWDATPKGVAFAPLVCDRFAEPHMAMVRLPAGLVSPPHVRSAAMFDVMIVVEKTHVVEGGDPEIAPRLGTGALHQARACDTFVRVADLDRVAILHQGGAFGLPPVAP